ncbi:acyl-CoA dehydrogenase [Solwaraspora sp. WMMD1047]|uniref:acyl-CoA dehydrogenase family protein n=1 Tax=Solwaraspora sp. WMMD1047 TaxID=3016102 RepID=UPI0024180C29|nr:acyl-CoA dehydrogenase [Solwaraspora sp. WMMD1047]MDG4830660.1 acyl-CoA dehydrogenase [Solwaraspora sp. WMMD1047]
MTGFELDDRLRALRGAGADLAGQLRAHAMAVDADPYRMAPYLDLAAYRMMRRSVTPLRYTDGPLRVGRFRYPPGSCLDQAVWGVELGYGDAGMVLACPGPSLAGVLVDELADDAQRDRFYEALADGTTWSFFALTEPAHGSDAGALETALRRDSPEHYRMYGTKRYIGNGSRGRVGVVFARTGDGPLAIRAALVTAGPPGFRATALDMVGLRGAALGEIRLDGVPVAAESLLGRHLSPTRQGLWGAVRVFNMMRVQVAALAVGTGLALVDLVRADRPAAPGAQTMAARLAACRRMVYAAAAEVDRDRGAGQPSSLAKLTATRLAREAARWAVGSLGPAALVERPLLEKWSRDVCAFEFMEGTSDIQRQHVVRSYLKGLVRRGATAGPQEAS